MKTDCRHKLSDDLYPLWLTWGTSWHDTQEWAALVMESCPCTEENQTSKVTTNELRSIDHDKDTI